MDSGELPATGSYLIYVQFMLDAVLAKGGEGDLNDAYTAAMLALARVCGAKDFTMVIGGAAGGSFAPARRPWQTECKPLTLNGRVDSRRHFTTAAALQAASNRGFAVSVGEFKELYDSLWQGSGFDFTDLAANQSGIRMSNRLMQAPAEDWPELLGRIRQEGDIIIPFDDLPQIMDRATFEAIFRDIESPEYAAMLAEIEASIDTLALHR